MINIAQFGYGYWGPNLARNFSQTDGCNLKWIIDADRRNLERANDRHPQTLTNSDTEKALSDPGVDAIVIATPAETHFELAAKGIAAGKHVFVEKPLCSNAEEAAKLVELAKEANLRLFVGHVFIYNAAVQEIKRIINSGTLGELYCVHSQRLSLGRVRNDVDVLWNLAPHDISILLHLLGENPVSINGYGHSFLQEGISDIGFIDLKFPSGTTAHIHCSWLHPQKTREMVFVGSKKMLVYDDVSTDAKIKIYDCGVDKKELPRGLPPMESFAHFQLQQRHGDITIPRIEFPEPLSVQSKAFVNSITTGSTPETDGAMGLEVVRILQQASPV